MESALVPPSIFELGVGNTLLTPANIRLTDGAPKKPKSVHVQRENEWDSSPRKELNTQLPTSADVLPATRFHNFDSDMERIRDERLKLLEQQIQSCANVKLHKGDSTSQNTIDKAVNNLISKQVDEIVDLKQKLSETKNDYECRIETLRKEKASQEHEYQQQMEALKLNHQQLVDDLNEELRTRDVISQNEMKEAQAKYISQRDDMARLMEEANLTNRNRESLTLELQVTQAKLSECERAFECKEKTISELERRLQNYKEKEMDREKWPQDKLELEKKLSELRNENENLKGENEDLSLRISALNDIINLQQNSLKTKGGNGSNDGRLLALLTTWRKKVLSLVVQQKSSELYSQGREHSWERLTATLTKETEVLKAKVSELEAVQMERDIQIAALSKQKTKLELSAQQLAETIVELEREKRGNVEATAGLVDLVKGLQSRFYSQLKVLEGSSSRMELMEERLSSANSQIRSCADSLAASCRHAADLTDRLAARDEECDTLRQQLTDSNLVKQDIQQKHSELQISLLLSVSTTKEQEETINKLRDRVDQLTKYSDLEAKRVELEVTRPYKEKLSRCDEEMLVLKRELAKTLVLLRQSERQQRHNLDSYTRELYAMTSQSTDKISRLESDLASAQAERNIVQSSLFALAGSKAHRCGPRINDSQSVSLQTTPVKDQPETCSLPATPGKKSMVESVSRLAASVLNSDTESDSDDNDISVGPDNIPASTVS